MILKTYIQLDTHALAQPHTKAISIIRMLPIQVPTQKGKQLSSPKLQEKKEDKTIQKFGSVQYSEEKGDKLLHWRWLVVGTKCNEEMITR